MPKIFAHRGASGDAPENTLAAFQLALEQRADGIELDVMLSKDGHIVVIHDNTVDRTTDGTGKVADMPLDELKTLDAGNGQAIPTLREVFERFGGQCLINIELKNYKSIFDSLPIDVAVQVIDHGLMDSVLISSFNPFNLSRFRRKVPDAVLGLLTLPGKADHWVWRLFSFDALHPHFSDVDSVLVSTLHSRDKQVNVWTSDDPEEIHRLAALNVDAIITNFPKLARETLEL